MNRIHNVHKMPNGQYKIRFIKHHYIDHAKTLSEAIKKRDLRQKELDIHPRIKTTTLSHKVSTTPDDALMPVGMSLVWHKPRGQLVISVACQETGVATKNFYAGTPETFEDRFEKAYERALAFRQAYEQAVKNGTIKTFNPKAFNKKNYKKRTLLTRHRKRRKS